MKKLLYEYSNGVKKIHTIFINNETILKESSGAKQVSIYKCNELQIEKRLNSFVAGEYVTTLLLK